MMGVVGLFLVIAALILGFEGLKAFKRYRKLRLHPKPASA
jgi:hypothetical protein